MRYPKDDFRSFPIWSKHPFELNSDYTLRIGFVDDIAMLVVGYEGKDRILHCDAPLESVSQNTIDAMVRNLNGCREHYKAA